MRRDEQKRSTSIITRSTFAKKLADIAGPEHVIADPANLQCLETTSFDTHQCILAVVKPGGVAELQSIVNLANTTSIPLYPISKGKNIGYGGSVPVADQSILVSLERLDKIRYFDVNRGMIQLEPGVTFTQAQAFLREQPHRFLLPSPGSLGSASVLGNTLERGLYLGLGGERQQNCLAVEAVLADGSLIHTGMRQFNTKHFSGQSSGLGPDTTGLFLQSNLGIVTKLDLALKRRPKFHQGVLVHAENLRCLTAFQSLLHSSVRTTNLIVLNASRARRYHMRPRSPWTAEFALATDDVTGLLFAEEQVRSEFKGTDSRLEFSGINEATSFFDSNESHLELPSDLGLLWITAVIPYQMEEIDSAVTLFSKHMESAAFPVDLSVQAATTRSVYLIAGFFFDRKDSDRNKEARRCHKELMTAAVDRGWVPYRLDVGSMGHPFPEHDDSFSLLPQLKKALDPNNIIAPGRYDSFHRDETIPLV